MTFYQWIQQCLQRSAEETKTDSTSVIEKVVLSLFQDNHLRIYFSIKKR